MDIPFRSFICLIWRRTYFIQKMISSVCSECDLMLSQSGISPESKCLFPWHSYQLLNVSEKYLPLPVYYNICIYIRMTFPKVYILWKQLRRKTATTSAAAEKEMIFGFLHII